MIERDLRLYATAAYMRDRGAPLLVNGARVPAASTIALSLAARIACATGRYQLDAAEDRGHTFLAEARVPGYTPAPVFLVGALEAGDTAAPRDCAREMKSPPSGGL